MTESDVELLRRRDEYGDPSCFRPENLPDFLSRVQQEPPPCMLIEDLLPELATVLAHGHPRAGKSLAAMEMSLALSSGDDAFRMERLSVPEAQSVLYVTEEDHERRVCERLEQLLARRGLESPPELFDLTVQRGVNIDLSEWGERLIELTCQKGYGLVILDPARAISCGFDQGPAQLQIPERFVRRFPRETNASLMIIHHDTKPAPGGANWAEDVRRFKAVQPRTRGSGG